MSILLYGEEAINTPAARIEEVRQAHLDLSREMTQIMEKLDALGVAANQVGFTLAMFVYLDGQTPRTIINPSIPECSGEWYFEEGCLSLPGLSFGIVRPRDVLLAGTDLEGNSIEVEATDLTARIFQHEMDHLAGKTVLNLVPRQQRRTAERHMTKIRKSHGSINR